VGLFTEPTCQASTAATTAQRAVLAKLRQKIGRLRVVAVFGRLIEEALGFTPVSSCTTVEKRNGEMILSFLTVVLGGVVRFYGSSVRPDGCGPIAPSSYSVLKAVADLKPGVTVVRPSRTTPPMKGSTKVAQLAVRGRDVVRCGRVPDAKLGLQLPNREPSSMPIMHTA
jgi:hypothetical protein